MKTWKLSELTATIGKVLTDAFQADVFWVIGEVSSHKFYADQDRHYLELIEKTPDAKDPIAKVKCIAWKEGSKQIELFEKTTGQTFSNNIQILVKVKVSFHGAYGLSLIVSDIDPSFTLGNIEKQRQLTLQRLLTENPDAIQQLGNEYVTTNKKTALASVIQQIAIVGSPKSEGYVDFIHTLTHNRFSYRFVTDIYQSSVQGADAENDLVESLIAIFKSDRKYDAVVIIRGGGAKTDFLVFDAYRICRTVARFPIPIITGIGHHNDVSLVDLLVCRPTKTPTQAAEFIIAHNRMYEESIIGLQKNMIVRSQQILSKSQILIEQARYGITHRSQSFLHYYKQSLADFQVQISNRSKALLHSRQNDLLQSLHRLAVKPLLMTDRQQQLLENLKKNMVVMSNKLLTTQKNQLAHQQKMIQVMSPENTLNRGFALVYLKNKLMASGTEIQNEDELTIKMKDAELTTKVMAKNSKHGK